MTDLSASIVLYRTPEPLLRKAVDSFLGSDLDVRLYLVDNSPDDRLRGVAGDDARISYIFNNANIGFGAGHNVALRAALDSRTGYHLVLNPDVSFDPAILPEILQYLRDNPDIGNLMPRVLYADGTDQRLCKLLPTPFNIFSRRVIPTRLRRAIGVNRNYELHFWSGRQVADIPCLSGCIMFLNMTALRDIGLFDEKMFMYLEDYDLNRRILRKYRTVFYPRVSVRHDYNRESFRSTRLLVAHTRSALYYFTKWGWLFDRFRAEVNRRALADLRRMDAEQGSGS